MPISLLPFRAWLSKVQAFIPGSCALCGTAGRETLCKDCRLDFLSSPHIRCLQCALPVKAGSASGPVVCGNCLRQPPAFDATVSATDYAAPVDQLVLGLKFGARLALAPLFAQLLRDALLQHMDSNLALPDCMLAVPLGAARLEQRGFNQAVEIAKPLARALGIPMASKLLTRVRETAAQSQLTPLERQHNLRGAFTFNPEKIAEMQGKHVAVVDDVMTTGQTLNEVALTLKRFGIARVTNLVVSRTPQK